MVSKAEHAEVRAAALRAKSKMELEEGNQLMIATLLDDLVVISNWPSKGFA